METKAYKPAPAMFFGGAVYVGVVLAMSTLFISFVLTAFPENAYFSRLVMTVGGVLVGLSAIAFPVALHTWTVERTHRIVATVLYYGEILIMAVNSVVSFMTLLSTYTDYKPPEWAVLYEPFSVASIVYTLAAWGTIFLLDPSHKRTQKEREADEKLFDRIAEKRIEFVESIEGENVIASIVANDIQTRYDPERFKRERKHFGGAIPAPVPFVKKESLSVEDANFREGKETTKS
jgi:hypothetical protein